MGNTINKTGKYDILKSYNLIPEKGIYPYDHIKGESLAEVDALISTKIQLTRDDFFTSLKQETISEDDYQYFSNEYADFTSFKDYMLHYIKLDVLILADFFENFRDIAMQYYDIDPCYCYSAPGLSWQAGLKFTQVQLKYFKPDTYDYLLMIEKGTRGGISAVHGNREVKCNNKVTNNEFDFYKEPTEYEFNQAIADFTENPDTFDLSDHFKESYLKYYDACSLYSSCMTKPLPTGEMWEEVNFKGEINLEYTRTTQEDLGFIYVVDLEYPPELHDKTKYYPLCPEKRKVDDSFLSNYQINHKTSNVFSEKLMLTRFDKYEYIVEGSMLDFYLDQGMILKTIHKKIYLKKSRWLQPFIEFNINKRNESKAQKDDFGDFFFKLLNNSFYGKTLENVRNRQDIEIVSTDERFKLCASKLTFDRSKIFTEDVAACHMRKTNIKFDKFNYVGFFVLEYSKLSMYDFVYNYLPKVNDYLKCVVVCLFHSADPGEKSTGINR